MKAMIHFIPAFMLASLREVTNDSHDWDVTDYTLTAIDRITGEGSAGTGTPNSQQRAAIRHYLEALVPFCSTKECLVEAASSSGYAG